MNISHKDVQLVKNIVKDNHGNILSKEYHYPITKASLVITSNQEPIDEQINALTEKVDTLHNHDNIDALNFISGNKIVEWDNKASQTFVLDKITETQAAMIKNENAELHDTISAMQIEIAKMQDTIKEIELKLSLDKLLV